MLDVLTQPFSLTTPEVPFWQFLVAVYAVGFLVTFVIDARRGQPANDGGVYLTACSLLWPAVVPLRVLYGLARIGLRR